MQQHSLRQHPLKTYLGLSVSALVLASCGGSDGGGTPLDDGIVFSATLIAPEVAPSTMAFVARLRHESIQTRMTDCADVPDGYAPLANVDIDVLDVDGNVLLAAAATTDECGGVTTTFPAGSDKIRASSAGNRDLVAGITSVVANGGLASTIPAAADYRVGFLTVQQNNTLGFSITDTLTNKAVVGLPAEAFSVSLDATDANFSSISTALTSESASIVLVTDASGSMRTFAFRDEPSSTDYNRLNLAASASHQFLDQKAASDEVAMVIFDRDTDLINQEFIDNILTLEDSNGVEVSYTLSTSGFTQNSSDLRLIVDAYNRDTKLYGDSRPFDNHPDTPAVTVTSGYRWGGSTAMYDATVLGSEQVSARSNPRKFIIAMTDGQDNRSSNTIDEVITKANANGTPVYTIGFEFTEEADLQRIADETGATYFQANSLQVSDAYSTIQTNILYQYVGVLIQPIGSTMTITLNLDLEGDGVVDATRILTN